MTHPRWCPPSPPSIRSPPHLSPRPVDGTGHIRPRKRPGSHSPEVVPTDTTPTSPRRPATQRLPVESCTSPTFITACCRHQIGARFESGPVLTHPRWCPLSPPSIRSPPHLSPRPVAGTGHIPPRKRPSYDSAEVVPTSTTFSTRRRVVTFAPSSCSITSPSLITAPGRHQMGARFDHPSVSPHGLWLTPGRCPIRGRPGIHSPEVTQHGPRDARCAGASMRRCEGRDRPHLAHDAPSRWSIWELAFACNHA